MKNIPIFRKDPPKPDWPRFYDRVILLVRDPFDTLLAEFNRRKTENHTGLANLKEFQTKNWIHYVETQSEWWKGFYKFFMENYQPSQLHIVQYENLKTNLTGELQAMMDFLPPNLHKFVTALRALDKVPSIIDTNLKRTEEGIPKM